MKSPKTVSASIARGPCLFWVHVLTRLHGSLIVEGAHSSAGSKALSMATTECSPERAAYDLHDKKRAYRRNAVPEYLVWQIEDERVDWFVLEEGA